MSQHPRPELRLSELESQMALHSARIREIADDTAESLRDLKQDIKQLSEHVDIGFKQAHAYIDHHMAELKATMATKEDLAAMETRLIETVKQLLQQKPDEG